MLAFQIDNVKEFMSLLLKNSLFDKFEVRQAMVQTFTLFEIKGILDKGFFTLEEQETMTRKYCLWSEIRPIVFQLIKGNKLPKMIRIVFSASEEETAKLSPRAQALFLNITFEQGMITCVTGSSQKDFSMDKSVEYQWDEAVTEFFRNQKIGYTSV